MLTDLNWKEDRKRHWKNAEKFLKWRKVASKKYRYLRNYNISMEEVLDFKKKQNYCCAICLKPFENTKKTHIDHDHYTLKVRGILCTNCNLGLGQFKDDITSLENAVNYLKENNK